MHTHTCIAHMCRSPIGSKLSRCACSVLRQDATGTMGSSSTSNSAINPLNRTDPFEQSTGHMVLKRKDNKNTSGWGDDSWGRGVGGGRKGGKGSHGGWDDPPMRRGKPLKAGAYGDINGRTYSVLEVGARLSLMCEKTASLILNREGLPFIVRLQAYACLIAALPHPPPLLRYFLLLLQVSLGEVVCLAKTWKKLNTESLQAGDQADLASAMKVSLLRSLLNQPPTA